LKSLLLRKPLLQSRLVRNLLPWKRLLLRNLLPLNLLPLNLLPLNLAPLKSLLLPPRRDLPRNLPLSRKALLLKSLSQSKKLLLWTRNSPKRLQTQHLLRKSQEILMPWSHWKQPCQLLFQSP
jgi:hypothetical protein